MSSPEVNRYKAFISITVTITDNNWKTLFEAISYCLSIYSKGVRGQVAAIIILN